MKEKQAIAYVSKERDLEQEPLKVAKRNLQYLENDLLPGDIILLWRIHFGTFTTDSWFPKYFEYDYGINASERLQMLIREGYVVIESAFSSLDHIPAAKKKSILKQKQVPGLSKCKVQELDELLKKHVTEEDLQSEFSVRGYALTKQGEQFLQKNQDVVERHPKKNL